MNAPTCSAPSGDSRLTLTSYQPRVLCFQRRMGCLTQGQCALNALIVHLTPLRGGVISEAGGLTTPTPLPRWPAVHRVIQNPRPLEVKHLFVTERTPGEAPFNI
jgi:hypothetical protein